MGLLPGNTLLGIRGHSLFTVRRGDAFEIHFHMGESNFWAPM